MEHGFAVVSVIAKHPKGCQAFVTQLQCPQLKPLRDFELREHMPQVTSKRKRPLLLCSIVNRSPYFILLASMIVATSRDAARTQQALDHMLETLEW
jgi:hypothetical protein